MSVELKTVLQYTDQKPNYLTCVFFLDMGNDLIPLFTDPITVHHPGGHFIPNQPDQRKAYIGFFTKMIEHKKSRSNS